MEYYTKKGKFIIAMNIKEFLYYKTFPKFPEIIKDMININQNTA